MHLLLDTNESRFTFISHEGALDQTQWNQVHLDDSLVRTIEKSYSGEIESIFLIQGKGGFAQTREGVVFANLYALLKGVELRELTAEDLSQPVNKWLSKKPVHSLSPNYFAEPNIS